MLSARCFHADAETSSSMSGIGRPQLACMQLQASTCLHAAGDDCVEDMLLRSCSYHHTFAVQMRLMPLGGQGTREGLLAAVMMSGRAHSTSSWWRWMALPPHRALWCLRVPTDPTFWTRPCCVRAVLTVPLPLTGMQCSLSRLAANLWCAVISAVSLTLWSSAVASNLLLTISNGIATDAMKG